MAGAAMRAAARRKLEESLNDLNGYISSVARRTGTRSILFGIEDIVQECMVVLWRVIVKYPEARGIELLKLFKRSLTRHLASIFRLEHVRRSYGTQSLSSSHSETDSTGGGGDWVYDVSGEGVYSRDYSILPWDFYRVELKRIEARLGRKRLKILMTQRNFGKGFPGRKEEIMKAAE
jgi:hypothetical protein